MIRVPIAGSWAWRHYGIDWVGARPAPPPLRADASTASPPRPPRPGSSVYATSFDSTEMQFWRSEQYRRDVGVCSSPAPTRSTRPARPSAGAQLAEWRGRAEQLNREGDGDTAAVYLRAAAMRAGSGPEQAPVRAPGPVAR